MKDKIKESYEKMLGKSDLTFDVGRDTINVYVNGKRAGYVYFGTGYLDDLIDSFEDMNLGFDLSGLKRKITYGERLVYVELLYVFKEYRKTGLGTELFKKFIDEMHSRGIFQIVLRAEPDENSISQSDLVKFYKKFGFREIDRNENGGVLMLKI